MKSSITVNCLRPQLGISTTKALTLYNKYMNSKKSGLRILTVGVFDLFHVGHLNLFLKAREYGDYLIVAVQDDPTKYKPGVIFHYSYEERSKIILNLRPVDKVIKYFDVDKIVTQIQFDFFAKGPDQNHAGFQKAVDYCIKHNKKIVVIPRTEGVSSSLIRKTYE